ncbi:autotransporter outer membrane beta-barrel domain-containing protein [Methyloceanibacter caenitepidi]|uniref:Autotransporter domain-containing protein n=1 Tax=Methyloceanibacter caenitepidi TaxID=1384459 RepID=A0A0A8K0P2_9HYPH|nr:autotransporter outer membrane beta-barrel domain-containing protein [Methyloceanibacter caenitepidi]BAQ16341.1 hypothetical protein GL4_0880 [Methyloceanibacter caenitepidi]
MRRRVLLAGTALATAFILSDPVPAAAQATIIASAGPVNFTKNTDCLFLVTCLSVTTVNPFFSAPINLTNNGDLAATGPVAGTIFATTTFSPNSPINLTNNGDLAALALVAAGISTYTGGNGSSITITNTGDIATLGAGAAGIVGYTGGNRSRVKITNDGEIATAGARAAGIVGITGGNRSHVTVTNNGDVATLGFNAYGVYAYTYGPNSNIKVTNDGTITTRGLNAEGIYGYTLRRNSDITATNTGDISTRGFDAEGMYLSTYRQLSSITANNSGTIATSGFSAEGIRASTFGRKSDITITNDGDIQVRGALADGIFAYTGNVNSDITINSSGSVRAEGRLGYGIAALSTGPGSQITVNNSGELYGSTIGLFSYSATSTKINNSGDISAGSGLAIDTIGASSSISNSGLITGFVDLTNSSDTFTNMSGGEFNASGTSRFRDGSDLFVNQAGGTLRTADSAASESTRITGLERFQNKGLITLVDGKIGDSFTMSNTPGGTDLRFRGSGKSTLGVDAFLGGPGSKSDTLTVEGTTTGRTRLLVNNVNPGPGQLNRQGIPVVFVDGNVNAANFYLEKPIDAGFFDYDLVFTPTGSGRFDLKSHAGGGSHILPHVITATHEVFHQSTETWFDQSVDLRALLARGSVCDDISDPQERIRCQDIYDLVPAVWARGGGTWLNLDDNGTTKANGRTYRYDLGRTLDIWQVESGVDFGKENILSPDDMLVFGLLGGAVESSLEYAAIARSFQISTLEAGAYATYLRGGFFLDTLFKAFFGTVEPTAAVEYPETLDTQTYGLRMDSGYRFGGLKDGPFVEPLGTIAISWTHVDDFSHQGNAVDFGDDEQVRGRLGLRVGTSSQIWEGTTFEPFVTGSFWGVLSGEHSATLTSRGTDFVFTDKPDEVWGEVSGGVNFFNPEAQTAVFAKVDYIFADQTEGVSARGGMRLTW